MSQPHHETDKTNGRWTKEEHENFLLGLQMYGKDWKKIEDLIGTRNGSQIRSHAQKFFLKFKKSQSNDSNSDPIELIQKENQTDNSKGSSETQTKFTDYSYFLGKIVEYSTNQGPFDFWHALIDHQQNRPYSHEEASTPRKSSFEDCQESEQEIQKLSSPTKRIKQ